MIIVLLIGHSYISRLHQLLLHNNAFDSNFNLDQCEVRCFGVGGGRIDTLQQNDNLWSTLDAFQPQIVICQIGGNDLCSPFAQPETIACATVDFLKRLTDLEYVSVAVSCEIFIRTNPRDITPAEYERRRQIVNQMLPILCEDANPSTTLFWKHLRLMNSPLPIFHWDGVHLSQLGYKKYYRSLRLAIMHALDRLI